MRMRYVTKVTSGKMSGIHLKCCKLQTSLFVNISHGLQIARDLFIQHSAQTFLLNFDKLCKRHHSPCKILFLGHRSGVEHPKKKSACLRF